MRSFTFWITFIAQKPVYRLIAKDISSHLCLFLKYNVMISHNLKSGWQWRVSKIMVSPVKVTVDQKNKNSGISEIHEWNDGTGVCTQVVFFFPSSPSHLSSSIFGKSSASICIYHPLCMTNLQCLEQETEDGQRKKDRKKERKRIYLMERKRERNKFI